MFDGENDEDVDYYVTFFVDRDMFMRYSEDAIGHRARRKAASAGPLNAGTPSESDEEDDEMDDVPGNPDSEPENDSSNSEDSGEDYNAADDGKKPAAITEEDILEYGGYDDPYIVFYHFSALFGALVVRPRKTRCLSATTTTATAIDASVPVPPATTAKRKYDALVADLGDAPPIGNGKRAKQDTMDTKGPLEKMLSMSKFFPRGVHPFYDIGLVMYVGSQSRWTVQVSTYPSNTVTVPVEELRSQRQYNNAFDKLVAVMHWKVLIHKFRKAAGDARQQDTSGLEHKTNYLPSAPTKSISPALSVSESKSDRDKRARAAVEDEEDTSEAPLTPEAIAALEALLNGCKLTNGKPALTASNFPSCFYADGAYDPTDLNHGCYAVHSCFVSRDTWTAPASAMDGAPKLKKKIARRFRCFGRRRRLRQRRGLRNDYDPRSSRRSELHGLVRLEDSPTVVTRSHRRHPLALPSSARYARIAVFSLDSKRLILCLAETSLFFHSDPSRISSISCIVPLLYRY
ncbi:hypothetical protein B0H19DRAFT_1365033 [Mycena capillaripes]|nr:hypothetical protein B0H19DRAFT_1365033 [Mycena capillaripes]